MCAIPAGRCARSRSPGVSDARLALAARAAPRPRGEGRRRLRLAVLAGERQNGLAETEWLFGSTWPQGAGCAFAARPARAPVRVPRRSGSGPRRAVLDGLVRALRRARARARWRCSSARGASIRSRAATSPAGRPGTSSRVGPLHGTHEPPFYVAGSDHWVAGYMEGAVRTGRARRGGAWCRLAGLSSALADQPFAHSEARRRARHRPRARARSIEIAESPISVRIPKPSSSASARSATSSGSQRANSPLVDAGADRVGEPRVQPGVELLGDRAQLGVAHRAQPQLHPQHPVVLQRLRGRAGTGRSSTAAARRASSPAARRWRSARRRRGRRSSPAPRPGAPRGCRSGSARARSRRRRPSRSGRSARRRCRRWRSAARPRRGSARARCGLSLTRLPRAPARGPRGPGRRTRRPRPRARQRPALVAAGLQALLDVVDEVDVLVEHEGVERWLSHWTKRVRGLAFAGRNEPNTSGVRSTPSGPSARC